MTKIIGLTGGIGSGKTTISKYIKSKGYAVYISDDEAKKLMLTAKVKKEVVAIFGSEVLDDSGYLDRKKLASIVFNDALALEKLNAIVHPKVKNHFNNWLKKQQQKGADFVFKEVAILFETKGENYCDFVLLVTARLDVRLNRVISRDNSNKKDVLARMNNQMPEEEKVKNSDFIITNISLKETYNQVDDFLKEIENSQ